MNNMSETFRGGTFCASKAGLAEGTNDATIKIAAPNGAGVDYAINGYAYHKADADNIDLTAADAQAVSTTCLYLICLDSSGTLSSVKGTEVATAQIGNVALRWPAVPANKCAIGAVKVATNASTTFTAGTTDLGAAGITDTYYDFIGGVPDAPIVA